MSKTRKSQTEGVFVKGRRHLALIYIRGEHTFLGSFDTHDAAAAKVADMARRHEGEWAG